ncbi:hypothetical protein LTR66_017563 [Elasticomyces elasticus]|nr:hypothetical protein LTR66_017563 [Elasticomyces elasticus]
MWSLGIRINTSLDTPSLLPSNDTNTSNLSYIPTLPAEKLYQEKREGKKGLLSGWFGSKEPKDDKEDRQKQKSPRTSSQHDGTRLDLLHQASGDSRRGTVELNRDDYKLEEARKNESAHKGSTTDPKPKESFIASLFGGRKHKVEKEHKKHYSRSHSPEPYKELKPDIDYSWTRFSILEERAIYRMAHIKLANPRRPLYSQVLLSNFMYSYLAKVQQMHPHMNLPTSAKQQKKQKEAGKGEKVEKQSEDMQAWQRYQQQESNQQQAPSPQPQQQQQQHQQPNGYEHQTPTTNSRYEASDISSGSNTRTSSRSAGNDMSYGSTGYSSNHFPTYNRSQQQQGMYQQPQPAQQYETDRGKEESW